MTEPDLQQTWLHPTDGTLWLVDHRATADSYVMRSDFGYSIGTPENQEVSADDLRRNWTMIETREQRLARRKRERDDACELARHDDPDNSGLCIHCGAEL